MQELPASTTPPTPTALEQLRAVFPGVDQLAGRLAPRSLVEYQCIGRWYLAWCGGDRARALDPQTLRAWRQHLVDQTRLSPNTINTRINAIITLVRASAACGAVDRLVSYDFSLVEKVKLSALRQRLIRSKHRRYTPQEIRALCQAPDAATLLGLRDRAFLATLAGSGCRISEVLSLTPAQIVPLGGGWSLQILGKGQAVERLAPLSRDAYRWVQLWLKGRQLYVQSDWIFTTLTGKRLSIHAARMRLRRYGAQVGLPDIRPHDVRRFVGTETAEKHGLRQAQKVLGHKSLNTTQSFYLLDSLQPEMTDGLY
jgi:integrase